MASNITLWVTNNVTGQLESNYNFITVTPDSPNTDYILIEFTEKQNCNNIITALFQNVTTNCDISEINIVSADTSDLVNGIIHWDKLGRYDAKVYYQSSDTNLDTSLATFAYDTCLDVSSNTDSCINSGGTDFDCNDLNTCPEFTDLQTKVDELEAEMNPPVKTTLTLPLVFDQNRRFKVTQTGDISYTLGSGHSSEFIYREDVINGNSINSITWDITSIALAGDALDHTKKNTIALIWDGTSIARASNQVSDVDTAPINPLVSSFTITDANKDQGILVFNEACNGDLTDLSLTNDFSDITLDSIISGVGTSTWVIQLSREAVFGETGDFVYGASNTITSVSSSLPLLSGTEAVDNQAGAPAAQPVYVSSEIGNVDDQTLTITVDINSNYEILGITLNSDGGALGIVANTAGDGTTTANYSLDRSVLQSENITITVVATNGITNALDGSKMMVAITGQTVTNNVVVVPTIPYLGKYLFDGNLNDTSGNGNNATSTGTINLTSDRNSNPDESYTIPQGAGNYINLGASGAYDLGASTITYAMWASTGSTGPVSYIDYGSDTGDLFVTPSPDGSGNIAVTSVGFGSTPRIDTGVSASGYHFLVIEVTPSKQVTVWVDDMSTPTNSNVDFTGVNFDGQLSIAFAGTQQGIEVDNIYVVDGSLTETEKNDIKALN